MNMRQPNSSRAEPVEPEFANAADAASHWWLQLQQPEQAVRLQDEFRQWLAADPRHSVYYQQCCDLQQQLSALSPVWQQQLLQAEPASWTDDAALTTAATQLPTAVVTGPMAVDNNLCLPDAAPMPPSRHQSPQHHFGQNPAQLLSPNAEQAAARQDGQANSKVPPAQLWWCRLAACVAMLAIGWLGWHSQTAELNLHWQTGVGQFASYQLPDGSTIELDAATKLEVRYAADERQILLEQGQAFFEVATDSSRPFVVLTPDSQVKVLGTGFAVGWFASYSQVEVAHGKVEFSYPGEVRQLTAGQRLQGKLGRRLSQLPATAVASWRQGYLSFDQQPLSEVVAVLNRYLTKPLQLADQQSAALLLTATFQLAQLAKVPSMLPKVLPVQLEAQPTQWLLRYQAEPLQAEPIQVEPNEQ
jgi:ferric-dicitrate binding protein FerR (iron transport regulator)